MPHQGIACYGRWQSIWAKLQELPWPELYRKGPIGVPQPFRMEHGEWGPPMLKSSQLDWELYSVVLICADVLLTLIWHYMAATTLAQVRVKWMSPTFRVSIGYMFGTFRLSIIIYFFRAEPYAAYTHLHILSFILHCTFGLVALLFGDGPWANLRPNKFGLLERNHQLNPYAMLRSFFKTSRSRLEYLFWGTMQWFVTTFPQGSSWLSSVTLRLAPGQKLPVCYGVSSLKHGNTNSLDNLSFVDTSLERLARMRRSLASTFSASASRNSDLRKSQSPSSIRIMRNDMKSAYLPDSNFNTIHRGNVNSHKENYASLSTAASEAKSHSRNTIMNSFDGSPPAYNRHESLHWRFWQSKGTSEATSSSGSKALAMEEVFDADDTQPENEMEDDATQESFGGIFGSCHTDHRLIASAQSRPSSFDSPYWEAVHPQAPFADARPTHRSVSEQDDRHASWFMAESEQLAGEGNVVLVGPAKFKMQVSQVKWNESLLFWAKPSIESYFGQRVRNIGLRGGASRSRRSSSSDSHVMERPMSSSPDSMLVVQFSSFSNSDAKEKKRRERRAAREARLYDSLSANGQSSNDSGTYDRSYLGADDGDEALSPSSSSRRPRTSSVPSSLRSSVRDRRERVPRRNSLDGGSRRGGGRSRSSKCRSGSPQGSGGGGWTAVDAFVSRGATTDSDSSESDSEMDLFAGPTGLPIRGTVHLRGDGVLLSITTAPPCTRKIYQVACHSCEQPLESREYVVELIGRRVRCKSGWKVLYTYREFRKFGLGLTQAPSATLLWLLNKLNGDIKVPMLRVFRHCENS